MNLLNETIETLHEYGKSPEDVVWCGSQEFGWFPFDVFKKLADKEYDDDYGSSKVAVDLLIVGNDFWLERAEYDGKEWWNFKTIPEKPNKRAIPKVIVDDRSMWESISAMQKKK